MNYRKKYGATGKSYDPGAAVKAANLIKSLDDEKLALQTEQSEIRCSTMREQQNKIKELKK